MIIKQEVSLRSFPFWAGAKQTVAHLLPEDLDTLEEHLEELFPDGIDETALNDFFWFEDDYIAELLGYEDFDELIDDNDRIRRG